MDNEIEQRVYLVSDQGLIDVQLIHLMNLFLVLTQLTMESGGIHVCN